jgi:hypothetical protein
MRYAAARVDLASRDLIIGGYMASAYANLHSSFLVWRARSDLLAHHVVHLDNWMHRDALFGAKPATPVGHIDSVTLAGGSLEVRGWAAMADGRGARDVRVTLNGVEMSPPETQGGDAQHVTLIDRPDVAAAMPHIRPDCGFALNLPAGRLFALADSPAPIEFSVRFRSDPDEAFAPIPTEGRIKGLDDRREAIAALPEIPDTPFMPEEVCARIVELLRTATCYLEYGTGGTTMRARDIGVPTIVAVESDAFWLEGVRVKSNRYPAASRCHFLHVDIGPTVEWGHPGSDARWRDYHRYPLAGWELCQAESLSPDLVLIDGRFRVACSLASLLFGKPGCRIVIDDYLDRPNYAVIERFVPPERTTGRAAEFLVPKDLPRDDIWGALLAAATDPA